MLTIYGIPNCSSVKKTRVWLEEHGIDYAFHDFKKQGIDAATLKNWLTAVPLEVLINKKGTTWRGLSAEDQAKATHTDSAIDLMMQHTSVIKRPVVASAHGISVGHDETALGEIALIS